MLFWTVALLRPVHLVAESPKVVLNLDVQAAGRFRVRPAVETDWPSQATVFQLPVATSNVTAAYVRAAAGRTYLITEFKPNAEGTWLVVPGDPGDQVFVEVSEKSQQFPTGRIVFVAGDAEVLGETARLESNPGNQRIGFWTDINDAVRWEYEATRWGRYDVELTYSLDAEGPSEIEVDLGGTQLTREIESTGSWYRYTTVPLGRVYLAAAGPLSVVVRGLDKAGVAVMNLKAITLRPVSEGQDVVLPAADGSVELDARDATVHGVTLRYEPNAKKLCLGYWSNPADWASWRFEIRTPGRYRVEIHQGCGAGHGGSMAKVLVADAAFEFAVEDTGHFQNFRPREVGTVQFDAAGQYSLAVKPITRKSVAVMDIRRIRLLPE